MTVRGTGSIALPTLRSRYRSDQWTAQRSTGAVGEEHHALERLLSSPVDTVKFERWHEPPGKEMLIGENLTSFWDPGLAGGWADRHFPDSTHHPLFFHRFSILLEITARHMHFRQNTAWPHADPANEERSSPCSLQPRSSIPSRNPV
jgi:hypothetical protein